MIPTDKTGHNEDQTKGSELVNECWSSTRTRMTAAQKLMLDGEGKLFLGVL